MAINVVIASIVIGKDHEPQPSISVFYIRLESGGFKLIVGINFMSSQMLLWITKIIVMHDESYRYA